LCLLQQGETRTFLAATHTPSLLTRWYHEEKEEAPIFIIGKEDEYINLD
jgi:hypothetical protein